MFKKLKDKLAEEVKSSPQKFQQFAQAAQAAVTSASSSISDITNSDLFSIGDSDSQPNRSVKALPSEPRNTFQDVSLVQPSTMHTSMDSMEFASNQDVTETQRQRRLSNSSFASDVSFRLPSYESPSMYHLQSDVEISASEAEERGFSGGNVSLDRVTKEQVYAAYRRTQERYTKYRTQYADLARHYKLLERDNAKARSVLVETQDKALRRISELREQCALEQSAKAHLEKALRIEIEEKNLKMDTLHTKIKFLKNSLPEHSNENNATTSIANESNDQLISFDGENNQTNDNDNVSAEIVSLNNKIDKLEKLVNKYKESLKSTKEKNAHLTTEIQILTGEISNKTKENEQLQTEANVLEEAKQNIQKLNELNEDLQNKVNVYEFKKKKEFTTLEIDLQKAQEEIAHLQRKIDVFTKREEEYAISLAENKLSIHKELESKESEIKSLKDLLTESKNEVQSLNIVLDDYKNNVLSLESESSKLKNELAEFRNTNSKSNDLEVQILGLTDKCQALETAKSKAFEEYKCLQLQLKQETAEKLAMIDRNVYLENRNTQLSEENSKKTLHINALDHVIKTLKQEKESTNDQDLSDKTKITEQIEIWKNKCSSLESEIQEERDELVKLQSEIEKLLANDEFLQIQNSELNSLLNELKTENKLLKERQSNFLHIKATHNVLLLQIKELRKVFRLICQDTKTLRDLSGIEISKIKENLDSLIEQQILRDESSYTDTSRLTEEYENVLKEVNSLSEENFRLKSEISDNERKTNDIDQKLERTNKEFNLLTTEIKYIQNERDYFKRQLEEVQAKFEVLNLETENKNSEITELHQQVAHLTDKLNTFENGDKATQEENRKLEQHLEEYKSTCVSLQNIINQNNNDKTTLEQHIAALSDNINKMENVDERTRNEKQMLEDKLKISNARCEELQYSLECNNSELKQNIVDVTEQLNKTVAEYKQLENIIKKRDEELGLLKITIDTLEHNKKLYDTERIELNKSYTENIQQLNAMKQENTTLLEKNKHTESSIVKLQHQNQELAQENILLKTQSEKITNNINCLEIELSEVRRSHEEIENEKDHLNSVIEELELNERAKQFNSKEAQTAPSGIPENFKEINLVGDIQAQTTSTENETLKEENKRLQSDVSGLQTYLAQISKENSILNDKLRELIASGETSTENQSEIQSEREKLEELIRENRELVEENLELKDQINSQHYAKQDEIIIKDKGKEADYFNLKEKYTNTLDANSKLEKRMHDLEQMNKSVNMNVSHLQGHNEKLKLTNEKLERRLDEALVSLRHLHSLQENTELEYLRNILYEYLTGTGAHSVTLAKVLAAVVKFDKAQTDVILQKEKERQGFLGQLGLL